MLLDEADGVVDCEVPVVELPVKLVTSAAAELEAETELEVDEDEDTGLVEMGSDTVEVVEEMTED